MKIIYFTAAFCTSTKATLRYLIFLIVKDVLRKKFMNNFFHKLSIHTFKLKHLSSLPGCSTVTEYFQRLSKKVIMDLLDLAITVMVRVNYKVCKDSKD